MKNYQVKQYTILQGFAIVIVLECYLGIKQVSNSYGCPERLHGEWGGAGLGIDGCESWCKETEKTNQQKTNKKLPDSKSVKTKKLFNHNCILNC